MFSNRIDQNSADTLLVGELDGSLSTLQNLQEQVTTGLQINQPSDNPSGTATALHLSAQLNALTNYSSAAQSGIDQLNATDSVLSSVTSTLQQVQTDLMTGANTSAQDATSRSALAQNVTSLSQSLLASANSTYNGMPLFSGTVNTSPYAYVNGTPGTGPGGTTGPGSYAYTGGTTAQTVTVGPGQTVPVGLVGSSVFGSGTSSVFSVLNQIASDLQSGNSTALSGTDLANLQAAMTQVSSAQAQVGSHTDLLQTVQTQNTAKSTALQTSVSNIVDVNEAQVATQLQLQETQYQAALSAVAKVIQPTLSEFIS